MTKKRRFGRVRQLPSGRWQARYPGPDGIDRPADETFATKTDAEVWLTVKEAEIRNGDWINPEDGKVMLAEYARNLDRRAARACGLRRSSCTATCCAGTLPRSWARSPSPTSSRARSGAGVSSFSTTA